MVIKNVMAKEHGNNGHQKNNALLSFKNVFWIKVVKRETWEWILVLVMSYTTAAIR